MCWSLDKAGPICRTVEDTALVLDAVNGYDADDAGSIDAPFAFDCEQPVAGLRIGYDPAWFDDERADPLDLRAIDVLRASNKRCWPSTRSRISGRCAAYASRGCHLT